MMSLSKKNLYDILFKNECDIIDKSENFIEMLKSESPKGWKLQRIKELETLIEKHYNVLGALSLVEDLN
jgi:hypothetical protein